MDGRIQSAFQTILLRGLFRSGRVLVRGDGVADRGGKLVPSLDGAETRPASNCSRMTLQWG